eukprot:TRINITY_DN109271_c0_g1_i1.p1 TRINITY_DN109271_c0_g1~~TRINITY_DN109271_c0_g1_i1.p1  ORF type:complete len:213 (+),score=38.51 TRINITY_DN109271_c0_g1_i1:83-640(+)
MVMNHPCRSLRDFVERGARRLKWPGFHYMEMSSPRSMEQTYLSSVGDAGTGFFMFPNPLQDSFCRDGPQFFLETVDSFASRSPKPTTATSFAVTEASDGLGSFGTSQSSEVSLQELRASALAQLGEQLQLEDGSAASETISSVELSQDLADDVALSSPRSSCGTGSWTVIMEDNLIGQGWDHCSQ